MLMTRTTPWLLLTCLLAGCGAPGGVRGGGGGGGGGGEGEGEGAAEGEGEDGRDAGAGDSGVADGGTADARIPEVGAPDVAVVDTGARDARVRDTGGGVEDVPVPEACADGPLALPIPDCRPQAPPSVGDPYEDCVARINQLRAVCQCLPPLARWPEGEACADQHSEYDVTRGAHAGFRARICSPGGMGQNECPGWGSLPQVISGCLQTMWDEGPGEPFIEHGHYLNMTNERFTHVACGFHTTPAGRVWSVQNFR